MAVGSPRIGVVAHRKKSFGGGLEVLRERLREAGHEDPLWVEVPKSKKAGRATASLVKEGAERVLVWGGDGTVQRAADVLAGTPSELAVLPAGTANLFATNLGIPPSLGPALDVALGGTVADVDAARAGDEHFVVMAGVGFDAALIRATGRRMKERFGRAAYVFTGAKAAGAATTRTSITVDGEEWFDGSASCVLVGNAGKVIGGLAAFPAAQMDDGLLDVGVVAASGRMAWLRVMGRLAIGRAATSPFVEVTRGRRISVRLGSPCRHEIDGGDRGATERLDIEVRPRALRVCVPASSPVAGRAPR